MPLRRIASWLAFVSVAAIASPCTAESRYSFDTTPGRLPKDAVPTHYSLRIVPDVARARFEGRAEIDLEVRRPVDALVLNASDLKLRSARLITAGKSSRLSLQLDSAGQMARLSSASVIPRGRHRLRIDYSGAIGKHAQGLFQVPYRTQENGRLVDKKMLSTHFEPVQARKMFPGWDEPAFRATFDIAVVIDEPLTAVSNMPVLRTRSLRGGKKEVVFARSVSMPTYLVALYIGELDAIHDEVDGIRLGLYSVKGKAAQGRYAMQVTKEIVRYFNEYFGERYSLPKLDQIALPGSFGGAMENWGAIVYIESRLLEQPATTSLRTRQSIYGLIAHEIAHQWFGNLVTMAWWDDLWLNEAFATWMSVKIAEHFHPAWQVRLRNSLQVQHAMMEDARRTTHPVRTPVENDARAMDIFDAITYQKGQAFVHMLESFLGEETFRDGVRRYMRAHRFSNASAADLWHHLGEASGKDVRAFAASWVERPGVPLVRVVRRCESGRTIVRLAQERFTLNDPQAAPMTWSIPVTLSAEGEGERRLLLGAAPVEASFGGCRTARLTKAGYYRVQYEPLLEDFERLPAADRLRFLADTFALVLAARAPVTDYLRQVERLASEMDRTMWEQVTQSMHFLRDLLDAGDRPALDRYVARLLARPFAAVGWDAKPGEDPETPALRRLLIDVLGRWGDAGVVGEARKRFDLRASRPIDAAIRPAVFNTVGRHADAAAFEALLAEMRSATDVETKWQAQGALRRVADPQLQQRWMQVLLSDELPPGDANYNLTRSAGESDQPEPVWQFVRAHLPVLYARSSARGRFSVLPETASAFADAARADELLELTRANLDSTALFEAERTAELIRLKAQVRAREAARMVQWVEQAQR